MWPALGKGKFVSVYFKDGRIHIVEERTKERIVLIPFQPNHGVMVSYYDEHGRHRWRTHCDFSMFKRIGYNALEEDKS